MQIFTVGFGSLPLKKRRGFFLSQLCPKPTDTVHLGNELAHDEGPSSFVQIYCGTHPNFQRHMRVANRFPCSEGDAIKMTVANLMFPLHGPISTSCLLQLGSLGCCKANLPLDFAVRRLFSERWSVLSRGHQKVRLCFQVVASVQPSKPTCQDRTSLLFHPLLL